MKKILIALTLSIVLFSEAFAHIKLETSYPKDGSTLDASPTDILMSFNNTIRLTKVVMTKFGNGEVKLNLGNNKQFKTDFSLSLPQSESDSGKYSIEWRGIGKDGHITKGQFDYTVK